MPRLARNNSAVITDDPDPVEGAGWAERCGYWRDTPTETYRRGTEPVRRVDKPLVLTGHGMRLNIDNGALVVRNGFTHYPQQQEQWRFFPRDRRLPSRIVIVDGSGGLSFDVVGWLSEQGVPLIRLDWRGRVTTVLGGVYGTSAKRVQEQVAAQRSGSGLAIARNLIHRKTINSMETLAGAVPGSPARDTAIAKLKIEAAQLLARPPKTIPVLLGAEGRVAHAYFKAWHGLPIRWKGIGRRPIPDDWKEIGQRQSFTRIKGRNQNASHPVNAILNYAYAVLEAQVRMNIVTSGYDPTIGYSMRITIDDLSRSSLI